MCNVTTLNYKYKLSRRSRKLHISDDARTLVALPKEVSERTWADILQKEENDLVVFDIREEILEEALRIGYEQYMDKQTTLFTTHCAAQSWLKLIDWHFFRHDPGEEPSAAPACLIPKRAESWEADVTPEPSPKDSWGRRPLEVVEEISDEVLVKWPSNSSIDMPVVEEIPVEYWFPGKVNMPDQVTKEVTLHKTISYDSPSKAPPVSCVDVDGAWNDVQESNGSVDLAIDSEMLQKVTNYSNEDLSHKESSFSALKTTSPVDGSLQGAGDSTLRAGKTRRKLTDKSKSLSKASVCGRSKVSLPPLVLKDSRISIISDCRLRNQRLDTQYEISSEKMDTPPGELVKRK